MRFSFLARGAVFVLPALAASSYVLSSAGGRALAQSQPRPAAAAKPAPRPPVPVAPRPPAATAPAPALKPALLQDEDETLYNLTFSIKHAAPKPAGSLRVFFDYQDEENHGTLDISREGLTLRSVQDGTSQVLARQTAPFASGDKFTLQRRSWGLRLLHANRVLASAFLAAREGGEMGSASASGWTWTEAAVQPVEEIAWKDDFTRLPGENGDWKPDSATNWRLTSSSEEFSAGLNRHHDEATRISMSSNPFALRAKAGDATVFTQGGKSFWDNYRAEVSVKPLTAGVVGLAVYVQDAKNYLALQWSSREGDGARQLVRVVDGHATVLAKAPGAYLPRQWYRLGMRTSPGYVEATIDGAVIFTARDASFGQGKVGLLARGLTDAASTGTVEADFDDAAVSSSFAFRLNQENGPAGSAWETRGGQWRVGSGVLLSRPLPGEGSAGRSAFTATEGSDGYSLKLMARSEAAGAGGLIAGYRDAANYVIYRWAGKNSSLPFKGRRQLVRYKGGRASIVRDEPAGSLLGTTANAFVPLTIRLDGDALAVFEGSTLVAQTADEALSPGKTGLWAAGPSPVQFRDIQLSFPPPPPPLKVTERFTADNLMVGWSTPAGEWSAVEGSGNRQYWHTGDYYADALLEYPWRKRAEPSARKLELALRARPDQWTSGYIARFEESAGSPHLKISLLRGDRTLKTTSFDWGSYKGDTALPANLRVRLEGDGVLISVGEQPVFSYLGSGPDRAANLVGTGGTRVGVKAEGLRFDVKEVRNWSANRDDYTFSEAPTDWYSPQGDWTVFATWPCYADWSFFGGQGVSPVLWTKRQFSEDITAQMYVHPQMDLPSYPGYSRPGDLNLTLAGDGKNLSSGYSFVVAGWDNTRTRILRGTKVVAENSTEAGWFQNAVNTNYEGPKAFHRHWFDIRAEAKRATVDGRKGVRLRLTLDEKVLCEYFDADPLPAFEKGGRVAIWTVDHGLMVARAKIEAARPLGRSLPQGLLNAVRVNAPRTSATPSTNGTAPDGGNINLEPREVTQPSTTGGAFKLPSPPPNTKTSHVVSALVDGPTYQQGQGETPVWKISNPYSGGLFKVSLAPSNSAQSPAMISATGKVEVELNLPPEAKLDLYVLIGNIPHHIGLNGPEVTRRMVGLGTAANMTVGDGNWKRYSFDLGAALARRYPQSTSWLIQDISIGALHGDNYRWLGFDGNGLGTTYQLRSARIIPQ